MLNSGIELLIDPLILKRLLGGFYFTLKVSLISILLSGILGTLFGVIRLSNNVVIRGIFRLYLEIVRILPTLVLLFVLYFTLPRLLDINIKGEWVGVMAFVFWGAAEMSDIVRSAIISLPKHQTESALAIGLNRFQLYRYVLLPQAFKQIMPPSLNLAARIIMTSSLLVLIGVREVIKVGKEIIEVTAFTDPAAPFWIYGAIMILFFALCYPLAKISHYLSHRKG